VTRAEATRVMARLAATYPATTITEDVAAVWYETALHGITLELGEQVARRLAATDETAWLPQPARFNAVRRAVQADLEPPALTEGPRTRDQEATGVRMAAECRKVTAAWKRDRPAWARKGEPVQLRMPKDTGPLEDAIAYRNTHPRRP
jgi:hypothetical protein